MSKNEIKQGLTYISDRGSQLRYSDLEGKEQWIQQVSRYKALEKIKRGQAVSIASAKEFKEYAKKAAETTYPDSVESQELEIQKLEADPDPFVVLTDTKKHIKCIGLALEPANVGEEVHILPFGKFTFDKSYEEKHNEPDNILEYNPNFTYEDVGKRVYVKYSREEDGAGNLTIDEEEVLRYYHNIISIGYLTDAPRADSTNTTTTIELSIQGDYRGPVDNTQFEGILGEEVTISDKDPIRLFAVGKEKDEAFHSFLRLTPQNKPFTRSDFIAVQKLDGRTAFIYPRLPDESRPAFNPDEVINDKDKSFLYMSKVYREVNNINKQDGCYEIDLKDGLTVEDVTSNISNLETALKESFKFVESPEYEITVESKKSSDPNAERFFGTMDIKANQPGGYFEIYISSGLLDRFTGSTTFNHGSFDNIGKVVLADIRIPSRREIVGIYIGNKSGKLEKGYSSIFMRTGEYKLLPPALESGFFGIGQEYFLGFNGRLTKNPYKQFEYISKVAFQKDENKLIFDIGTCHKYYDGSFPIGYMKPSVKGANEYGFLLMDGVTEYKKEEPYLELYNRLTGWFPENEINVPEKDTFIVPKVTRPIPDVDGHKDVLMQIKYLADGIYEDMPKFPFIRSYGQFEKEDENSFKKPTIKEVDVTSIIDLGFEEQGFANPDISNLDIHLYVDFNKNYVDGAHDWVEIRDGFFNYNNSNTFGFNWKLNVYEANAYDAPFGKVTLSTDIGAGQGISYVKGDNSAPLKLDNCYYKVYVARREMFPRQFDLEGIQKNYISNSVFTDDTEQELVVNKAVSGKAVMDAINNRKEIDMLMANENAEIELGKKDAAIKSISIVTKGTAPIVADKIEIANSFDTQVIIEGGETVEKKSEKLVFENDKAFLRNSKNESIFSLDTDTNEYKVDGEQVPTVTQVRAHAEKTIDGTPLKDLIKETVDNKHGAIHGMVFGVDGNIDASVLNGLKLGLNSKSLVTGKSNLENAYIPYAYKGEDLKYHQNIEGSLDFQYTGGDGNINTIVKNSVTYSDSLESGKFINNNYSFDDFEVNGFTFNINNKNIRDGLYNFKQEFNFKTGSIGFYKVDTNGRATPANVIFGGIQSGSRSEYKKIYGEKRRSELYSIGEDGEKTPIPWTELDKDSIKYTDGGEAQGDSTNKFTTLLGSALQAAYELPMAYWQYRTEEDWYKKSMGVIVERVEDVAKDFNDTMKRNLFDNIDGSDFEYPEGEGRAKNHNEFNYTSKEVESIKTYLSDIINNNSTGINVTDIVGLLLNAAQETQERLLKVETSTFGDDYESIPGDRTSYDLSGLNKDVTANPTNLGLNRLIRAICLELYQTANPYDANDFDVEGGEGKPILSRIDRLDIDIHGKLNSNPDGDATAGNELSFFDATTYPYNDVVYSDDITAIRKSETTTEEQKEAAKVAGTNVETRQIMKDKEPISDAPTKFNGIVDAIYRITTKLNALTESVNGEDNIANAPLRLNTIRQNIEHIIRESYLDDKDNIKEIGEPVITEDGNGTSIYTKSFEKEAATPYVDTNELLDNPFEKDNSRFDRLTKALYDFTISRENASQEFGTFKEFGEELQEDSETPVYYTGRQFNGKNLLTDSNATGDTANDIKSHVPQNLNDYNYATLLDIVVDAIGKQYYRNNTLRRENDNDATFAKDIKRHNKTISDRLDEIEGALDKVVLKLSRRHHFEDDTTALRGASFSIESYTEFLNEYLGYSQVEFQDNFTDGEDSSFKESWKEGINSEVVENKFSAEFAFNKKANIQAGLINTLYRLQKEESISEKYNAILGKDFASTNETISQTASEDLPDDETYQKSYTTSSGYNLTDDVADVLKTLYGEDTPDNVDNPTSFTHRTQVAIKEGDNVNNRFVHNTKDDNIIDKMINEAYYLPQPMRYKVNSDAGFIGDFSDLIPISRGDEKDSRDAIYFDFDKGTNVYDIKESENALSNNNRNEFFNQIGRNEDPEVKDRTFKNYRRSRFQVLENEIRSERKLLGNNLSFDDYNKNQDAIDLKFNGKLNFTGTSNNSLFEGINFANIESIDNDTNQYNKTGNTSILEFILGTDRAGRLVRNELGFRNSAGFANYFDVSDNHVKEQGSTRHSIYERVHTLEKELDKFTNDTESLLKWDAE